MAIGKPPTFSVFIVDDDGTLRALIKSILRAQGIHISGEASSSLGVVDACKRLTPKVVLLDINLPENSQDGLSLLQDIKALPDAPLVIMVSGEATLERVQEARTKGADGFVVKPFTLAKLMDSISFALKGGRSLGN